jgi:hypothetical protein
MPKLILESASISESIDFNGKTIDQLRQEDPKVIRFIVTLQTTNVKNRNDRYYPRHVLEQGMNDPRIQDIIRRNNFFLEMGHPPTADVSRQQRVEESNTCGILKKFWFEGNNAKGLIETTADTNGLNWKNKILWNGLIPAFSLRATGDFHWDHNIGANVIDSPLTIFSYDVVQYPSHAGAVMESLTESAIFDMPKNSNKYNSPAVFNEGMIIEIPDEISSEKIISTKKVHNITESYHKNVKKTHEFYAYSPKDKAIFNEDHTVTVERDHLIKVVNVQDYIKKDISYNIYNFLNGKK